LDRLKELSQRKGEPITYYKREGIALVLDKYAKKKTTGRKANS
jgi:predicted DNA-binding protein